MFADKVKNKFVLISELYVIILVQKSVFVNVFFTDFRTFFKETLMATDSYNNYCKIRDKLGYKDSIVATGAGVTKSTFSDWKAGRYQPKDEKLQKIASFLGVSVEYLMTGEEQNGYYLNEETAKLAQEMFEDEDMRSLFDMKRNMPPERFKAHMEFMKNLYEQEKGKDI